MMAGSSGKKVENEEVYFSRISTPRGDPIDALGGNDNQILLVAA